MLNKSFLLCFFLVPLLHIKSQTVNFTSSNLPIVIINTNGQTIPDEPKLTANMKIIYNGPNQTNQVNSTNYHYNGFIGIELRGNSSQTFDQKQYGIETRDANGGDIDVPLLGMPAEADWVLYAPYNDISMVRNVIAYHLWDKMNHWGSRTRMCEVVLNGNYQGVYVLTENIKRGDDRVKIAKLKETDNSGLDVTGGYIMKIDAENNSEDKKFTSKVQGIKSNNGSGAVTWLYHYPKPANITPAQEDYIHKYIDTVETVIQSSYFADPVRGYSNYISVQSFVDYFIHTELSLNSDGYKRSAYFYKEKLAADGTKGKLKAGPVWDYNLAYGFANFCLGNQPTKWVYEGCETLPTPAMWRRLTQDPNFMNRVKCRYQELRQTILSDAYIHGFINAYADTLNQAQARHFTRWQGLLQTGGGGTGGWFNFMQLFSAYRVSSYTQEIGILKNWFTARLAFLDTHLGGQCVLTASDSFIDKQQASLYPNPTDGKVYFDASIDASVVEVYSGMGQKLATLRVNSGEFSSFDMSDFQAGVYLIQYKVGDTVYSKIIMKQD